MNRPVIVLSHIAIAAQNNCISRDGKLPWHIPEDLSFFHNKTKGKAIIMGRKTYESLKKSLPHRLNVVVTRRRRAINGAGHAPIDAFPKTCFEQTGLTEISSTLFPPPVSPKPTAESLAEPLKEPLKKSTTEARPKPSKPSAFSLTAAERERLTNLRAAPLAFCPSVETAAALCSQADIVHHCGKEVFITGGGEIFQKTIRWIDRIYLTRIHADYEGDVFYPKIPEDLFYEAARRDELYKDRLIDKTVRLSFITYERRGKKPSVKPDQANKEQDIPV